MFCHFVFLHRSNTVPDPNLEIRGEGPLSLPIFFGPSGLSFVFLHQSNTVLDPDLEMRGKSPVSPPIFFWPFGPQFGPKIRGEGQPPQEPSPGSTTATQPCPIKGFLVAILSTSNYSVPLMSFSKYHNCLTNLVKVTCSLL